MSLVARRVPHTGRATPVSRGGPVTVRITRDEPVSRRRCDRDLARVGITLPLYHRAPWLEVTQAPHTIFLCLDAPASLVRLGIGVDVVPVRSLPGHRVWVVRRLGAVTPERDLAAALGALVELARAEPRLLRIELQTFADTEAGLARAAAVLWSVGFRPNPRPRGYRHTVKVDLHPDRDGLFASFNTTARQNIRAPARKGLVVAPILDGAFASRMEDLSRESFARTGGTYVPLAWNRILALARRRPQEARVVGLLRPDESGPSGLIAFALAYAHGDHVEYAAAASTRPPDLKVPLSYAVAWDLMLWARETGARWFDFGGITPGRTGGADRCGGISDFKRMFSKHVIRCAEEWTWTSPSAGIRVASALRRGIRWLRSGIPAPGGLATQGMAPPGSR